MTFLPHLSTLFHTSNAQVWTPASTTTTTPSYGVWGCGVERGCGVRRKSPHHTTFHTCGGKK